MIDATKLDYAKRLKDVTAAGGGSRFVGDVFRTFCTMSACAVAAGTREEEYLEAIKGYEREDLDVFAEAFALLVADMQRHEYRDLLGPLYAEWGAKGDRQFRGEFYTPWEVSDLMARLALGDDAEGWPEDRPVDCLEPACGSGGMVLSTVKELVYRGVPPSRTRWTCVDLSKTACDMSFVNLTLWGVPAEIVWGNSLTLEVFASWKTVFWRGDGRAAAGKTLAADLLGALAEIGASEGDDPGAQVSSGDSVGEHPSEELPESA